MYGVCIIILWVRNVAVSIMSYTAASVLAAIERHGCVKPNANCDLWALCEGLV